MLIEVGALVPIAGASRFIEYGDPVPMRLGPGDVRFEFAIAYVFGIGRSP